MKPLNEKNRRAFQENLVKWFISNQRSLPWRKTYDPYQVWISEIMLQQTQVKTALPYFERWMRELPDVKSVAKAPEEKILKVWEGLGYYSRARNLMKAAKMIGEVYGGKFPSRHEDILGLPGIGRYSAGAISSIAFNREKPIVDGNVIRVLARLMDFRQNTRMPSNAKKFWIWAEELIPKNQARNFNQGMMELGALVCVPRDPKCGACPLRGICESRRNGTAESLPNRGKAEKKVPITMSLAVIRKNGKIFIRKRPANGLMGGLWEFPGGRAELGETNLRAIHREIKKELGVGIKKVRKIARIRHSYTKFDVSLHCYEAEIGQGKIVLESAAEGKWVSPKSLGRFAFPAADRKLINEYLS